MTLQTTLWNFHTVKNELSTLVFFFFLCEYHSFPLCVKIGGSVWRTAGVLCFLHDLCLVLLIVYSSLFCIKVRVWLLVRVVSWVWMFGLCYMMHHSTENVHVSKSLTHFLKLEKKAIMSMLTHVEEAGIPQITNAQLFYYLRLMHR